MKRSNVVKPLLWSLVLALFSVMGFSQNKHIESAKKPLIVLVTGDHEYSGEQTLPIIAKELEKN